MTKLRGGILFSLFLCSTALLVACPEDDEGFECTVTWYDANPEQDGNEVGSDMFVYSDLGNADSAVDRCGVDQETADDRPAEANFFFCNCESR